jgi:HSP20 family molecular chaperone IbpA
MKRERKMQEDFLTKSLSTIGIAAVALLLITLFRVKSGILGIIIGAMAVAVLAYWLVEIKNTIQEGKTSPKEETEWFHDLIEEGENIDFVANVPGPEKEVRVRIVNKKLEIKGGANFLQRIDIPKNAKLQKWSHSNGVLHAKLRRDPTPDHSMRQAA